MTGHHSVLRSAAVVFFGNRFKKKTIIGNKLNAGPNDPSGPHGCT